MENAPLEIYSNEDGRMLLIVVTAEEMLKRYSEIMDFLTQKGLIKDASVDAILNSWMDPGVNLTPEINKLAAIGGKSTPVIYVRSLHPDITGTLNSFEPAEGYKSFVYKAGTSFSGMKVALQEKIADINPVLRLDQQNIIEVQVPSDLSEARIQEIESLWQKSQAIEGSYGFESQIPDDIKAQLEEDILLIKIRQKHDLTEVAALVVDSDEERRQDLVSNLRGEYCFDKVYEAKDQAQANAIIQKQKASLVLIINNLQNQQLDITGLLPGVKPATPILSVETEGRTIRRLLESV